MFLSDNIKYLRRKAGHTQDVLSKRLGVKRSVIGSYEEGRATPKIEILTLMSKLFSVSIDDLINVDIASGIALADYKGERLRVLSIAVDDENVELITAVPVKARAGYLKGYADAEYIGNMASFNLPLPEIDPQRTYRAFQIQGDSMLPIPSGAYIIAEFVQNWNDIKDETPCVLITQTEGVVYKRVQNKIQEVAKFLCKSDNTFYEPFEVDIQDICEIWKAYGYISFSLPDAEQQKIDTLERKLFEMQEQINRLKLN